MRSVTLLARYNRQKAVTISARLVGDYSLDEALNFLLKLLKIILQRQKLLIKEKAKYKKTNTELYIIFILALVTAYLAMRAI